MALDKINLSDQILEYSISQGYKFLILEGKLENAIHITELKEQQQKMDC